MSTALVRSPLPVPINRDNLEQPSPDNLAIVLRCLIRQLTPFSPQTAARQAQLLSRYIAILHNCQLQLELSRSPSTLLEAGTFTTGGLVSLDWIKPFVDCQTLVSFPGLALSKLAYGTSSENELNNLEDPQTFCADGDGAPHPVFPSSGPHIFVWRELQQLLWDVAQKEQHPRAKSHHHHHHPHFGHPPAGHFANEHTNNDRGPCALPDHEPFIVRLRIRNPFPFPLLLHNLCLSLGQIKLRPNCSPPFADKFQCSIISELNMPAAIVADSTEGIRQMVQEEQRKRPFSEVDLRVMPGPEMESFTVDGIKFELGSPIPVNSPEESADQNSPSISAFVPISVQGKRLFKTKEHRISKHYAPDNRLKVKVQAESTPLISFRPIGGDPALMRAITQYQPVEGYADQIVQMAFEIENVGKVPVAQLRFCSNYSEQVSIGEPLEISEGASRWAQCPARSQPTNLLADDPFRARELGMDRVAVGQIAKITRTNPMGLGARTGLRVAIRLCERPQIFYFLFWYIGENGHSRQFRFAARTVPLSRIFSAHHRMLSPSIGLHLLDLHCLPSADNNNSPSGAFTKLELLRLSARYIGPDDPNRGKGLMTTIRRLDNKFVQLESATRQNLCFYALLENSSEDGPNSNAVSNPLMAGSGEWTHLWMGQTCVPDISDWQIAIPEDNEQRNGPPGTDSSSADENNDAKPMFQLKLLWKASIVRDDGTMNTVFGELIVGNSD